MSGYKPYPKYKESGIEWLGAVPDHWDVKRIRFMTRMNPTKQEVSDLPKDTVCDFFPMDAVGEDGSLNTENQRQISEVESGFTYFAEGDVTYAKITPCFENGKGAVMQGLSQGFGFGTTELTVIRPNAGVTDSKYLWYLTKSSSFRKLGESWMYGAGGQKRVPDNFCRDLPWSWASIKEQQIIAKFLDREASRIDTLIQEQRELIELLKEKRQALISNAVTKGLNPNVKMKESGVGWIGEIPAHWVIYSSRRLFSERKDRAFPDDIQLTASQKYGIVTQKEFTDLEDQKVVQVILGADLLKHVEPNDFVISMRSFQGGLEYSSIKGCISSAYVMLIPDARIFPLFFKHLFKSNAYIQALQSTSNLVRDGQALRFSNFAMVSIPLPPYDEQKIIAMRVDRELQKIDALSTEAESAIVLMQEHRVSLISEAVTGKIDVRGINVK